MVLNEIKNHISQIPSIDFNQSGWPSFNVSDINFYQDTLNVSENSDQNPIIDLELLNSKIMTLN